MTEMTIGEFKTHFSEVVKKVRTGEKIAVTSGKKKKIVGYFVPEIYENKNKRKLGILEGKATMVIHGDFKMTIDEFYGKF
ncbi:MAG: type II toxin-antitoxin system prevent-host-death family antitoxin [Pelobium sp.]